MFGVSLVGFNGFLNAVLSVFDALVCGFSKTVVSVLDHYGVEFHDVNILGHEDMRPAFSELSGWPTFPQLFVNGKLLGGCDITVEMHENGQLLDALDV